MDGRSKYYKVKKLLDNFVPGSKLHMNRLRALIVREIGATEKTINESISIMLNQNLIREIEPMIFETLIEEPIDWTDQESEETKPKDTTLF